MPFHRPELARAMAAQILHPSGLDARGWLAEYFFPALSGPGSSAGACGLMVALLFTAGLLFLFVDQGTGFDRDEGSLEMVDQKINECAGAGGLVPLAGIVDKQVG